MHETSSDTTRRTWDGWGIAFGVILALALLSRFWMLGEGVTSHDESIHTQFSWYLYAGQGFRHNPMMHGPLLFEATALSYFLFGVSDFAARIFVALTGVALVLTPWLFRRWIGRWGALSGATLLLISPLVSYYSRYIRHDIPLILCSVLAFWAILSYLESGKVKWLYALAASFSLMHALQEASYIYIALFMGLFGAPFAWQALTCVWEQPQWRRLCLGVLALAVLLAGAFAFSYRYAETDVADHDKDGNASMINVVLPWWGRGAGGLAFVLLLSVVMLTAAGLGEATLRRLRLFDALMVLGTLVLPFGSATLIKFIAGVDVDTFYTALMAAQLQTLPAPTLWAAGVAVGSALLASALLGLWWNRTHWPFIALTYYAIYLTLYTTFFTWGWGAVTGMVGGLMYWMGQQGVTRGNQPWFYYLMLGGLYETLPLLLAGVSGVAALRGGVRVWRAARRADSPAAAADSPLPSALTLPALVPLWLGGWALLSWIAYTIAGEKMPWLLTHIITPHILLAAWGLGRLLERVDWGALRRPAAWVWLMSLPLLLISLATLSYALTHQAEGSAWIRWQVVSGAAGALLCIGLFNSALEHLHPATAMRLLLVLGVAMLAALTTRAMLRANYVNRDNAVELLLYSHGAPDIRLVLQQITDLSWRTTGTPDQIKVAYGQEGSWPLVWYMNAFPNNYFYGTAPERQKLLECPVIIAGTPEQNAVEALIGDAYARFDYNFLWFPIQDYFELTADTLFSWEKFGQTLGDPAMRAALWDILWKRDYTRYWALTRPDLPLSAQNWPGSHHFRFYVRRDLAATIWGYNAGVVRETLTEDPFASGERSLSVIATAQMPHAMPRGIAADGQGAFYVTDTANHRIWHIAPHGDVLGLWGEYGIAAGQFNEPWGVAVDAQGDVYVADTWNHRVQKFDAQGRHMLSWGRFGQVSPGEPLGYGLFYGPRGVAAGPSDEVFVADTGNHRVQVFSASGEFQRIIGGAGDGPGGLSDPVGVAVTPSGEVFVADTWQRRVLVFDSAGRFLREWSIPTWRTTDPESKPGLTLSGAQVYVSDPASGRVLAFTAGGEFLWSARESGIRLFPQGVAAYAERLYFTDPHSGQMIGYELPQK